MIILCFLFFKYICSGGGKFYNSLVLKFIYCGVVQFMVVEQLIFFYLYLENLLVFFDYFLMDEKYCNKKVYVFIVSSNWIIQESLVEQNLVEEYFIFIK